MQKAQEKNKTLLFCWDIRDVTLYISWSFLKGYEDYRVWKKKKKKLQMRIYNGNLSEALYLRIPNLYLIIRIAQTSHFILWWFRHLDWLLWYGLVLSLL